VLLCRKIERQRRKGVGGGEVILFSTSRNHRLVQVQSKRQILASTSAGSGAASRGSGDASRASTTSGLLAMMSTMVGSLTTRSLAASTGKGLASTVLNKAMIEERTMMKEMNCIVA